MLEIKSYFEIIITNIYIDPAQLIFLLVINLNQIQNSIANFTIDIYMVLIYYITYVLHR